MKRKRVETRRPRLSARKNLLNRPFVRSVVSVTLKRSLDENYPEGWLLGVANVSLIAHETRPWRNVKNVIFPIGYFAVSLFGIVRFGSRGRNSSEKKRLAVSLFRFIKSQTVWTIFRDCGGRGGMGRMFFVGRRTKRRKSSSVVLSRCVFGRHRPFGMLMRDYGAATVVIRELFVRLTCATARLKHPLNYPH